MYEQVREGPANKSLYIMRDELVKRNKKKKRRGKISSGAFIISLLPMLRLFFMEYTLETLLNPWLYISFIPIVYSFMYYQIYYLKAKNKYDSLKEELRNKVRYDYYVSLEEREEFLKNMSEKYDINLYWK